MALSADAPSSPMEFSCHSADPTPNGGFFADFFKKIKSFFRVIRSCVTLCHFVNSRVTLVQFFQAPQFIERHGWNDLNARGNTRYAAKQLSTRDANETIC